MKYAIYNTSSGQIEKVVSCAPDDLPLQFNPATQAALEGEFPDDQYYVVNGEPVAIPASPSPNHAFDFTTKTWVDPRTLADVKAAKNAAIDRARAAANTSFFMFQGKQISVDPLSRSDIDAAHGAILMLQAMPPGWPGGWKAKDRTIVAIPDVAVWSQFYGTMVATGTANFNHSQTLKAQLDAATTIAEVEAIPNW